MNSQLVFEKKGQAFTDSMVIAKQSENQHESVVRLINNNREDLEEYGKIEFTDLKSGNLKGRKTNKNILTQWKTVHFAINLFRQYWTSKAIQKRFGKSVFQSARLYPIGTKCKVGISRTNRCNSKGTRRSEILPL